jgi:hypothetical protein
MPVPPATIVIARTPASAASRHERALAGPARHALRRTAQSGGVGADVGQGGTAAHWRGRRRGL